MDDIFSTLPDALTAFQTSLRVAGLSWLATHVPTRRVITEDDFLTVQKQLHIIRKLLLLRPPERLAFRKVEASLVRVDTLVAVVERAVREQYRKHV